MYVRRVFFSSSFAPKIAPSTGHSRYFISVKFQHFQHSISMHNSTSRHEKCSLSTFLTGKKISLLKMIYPLLGEYSSFTSQGNTLRKVHPTMNHPPRFFHTHFLYLRGLSQFYHCDELLHIVCYMYYNCYVTSVNRDLAAFLMGKVEE